MRKIKLDLDFSNPLRFPLKESAGIIIIRIPVQVSLRILEETCGKAIAYLSAHQVENSLWIVEPGRIRIHTVEKEE